MARRRRGDPIPVEEALSGELEVSSDTRQLSRKPSAVRARIRRSGARVTEDILIYHEITYGTAKPVSEWTWEELQHGRPRHPTGGWKGPRPTWITPIVLAEVRKRLRDESLSHLNEHAGKAIKVLAEFLGNVEEPGLRFKAAKLILEYAAGEPVKQVNVEANVTLHQFLADALVLDDGAPAHPNMIEGDWTDTDEKEDDDDASDG